MRYLCVVILFASLAACSHVQRGWVAMMGNPYSESEASIDKGRLVFGKLCAQCHGARGHGDGPLAYKYKEQMPDFTNGSYDKSLGLTAANIMYGKRNMPAYKEQLREQEIWAVARFVVSLRYRIQPKYLK